MILTMRIRGSGLSEKMPLWMLKIICEANFWYHYYRNPIKEETCPVCSNNRARVFPYGKDLYVTGGSSIIDAFNKHDKYCCTKCKHYYASWFRKSLREIGAIYSKVHEGDSEVYQENDRRTLQEDLMLRAWSLKGKPGQFKILDFGCGANYRAAYNLRQEGIEAYCCDILPDLPYDGKVFIRQSKFFSKNYESFFDAIISVDVLEHLSEPLESFYLFNKLLKPAGTMIHFSPIMSYMPVYGSHADTALHTNFFSKRSLEILCKKTGFRGTTSISKKGDWYYLFIKE